jgi:dipeptidase E
VAGRGSPLGALGWLEGSLCPHYGLRGVSDRSAYRALVAARRLKSGWGLDDGAAAHFVDGGLVRVVSSRPQAGAYRVEPAEGAREQRLAVQYLVEGGPGLRPFS